MFLPFTRNMRHKEIRLTHRAPGGSATSISSRPVIFCDFDGTVTLADVTDEILKRLAAPGWMEIERMWSQGMIGSKECLERQLALVATAPSALNALIDSIPVDPHFAGFLRFVRANTVPFFVVSDGLDYVIRRVLRRCGVRENLRNGTHFFSSSVRLRKNKLSISFPHALGSCTHGCATCKPLIIRSLRKQAGPVLYIGDGFSDRHAVAEADFVYARRPLLGYCREKDIPSCLFENFSDVERSLAEWLSGEEPLAINAGARRSVCDSGF
jgi:2-hydroxy-3-keto-5-methylthiopentenyl-1-phosphate phosphatase